VKPAPGASKHLPPDLLQSAFLSDFERLPEALVGAPSQIAQRRKSFLDQVLRNRRARSRARFEAPAPTLPKRRRGRSGWIGREGQPLAVSTIASSSAAKASDLTHELDTPAELPSGRTSFGEALGRETALERQRERAPARRRDERDAPDAHDASLEAPVTPVAADRSAHDASHEEPLSDPLEGVDGNEPIDGIDGVLSASGEDPSLDGIGDTLAGDDPLALNELTDAEAAALAEAGPAVDPFEASPLAAESKAASPDADAASSAQPFDPTSPTHALAAAPAESHSTTAVEPRDPALGHVLRAADEVRATSAATNSIEAAASSLERTNQSSERASERLVTLAELPRALQAEVDGFLRVHGRGRHWEAELRLDPPELGALHVHLEMRGQAVHGVVRAEDPRLEPKLERFLQNLEQDLQRQGSSASFDLSRGTRQQEEGEMRASPASARSRGRAGDASRSVAVAGVAAPVSDRLVDLFA